MTNLTTLTGNMGREAALRFTSAGKAVLHLSIADTPRRRNPQTQEWEDAGETLWVDVSVWGEDAESLAEALGSARRRLTVTGRLGWRTYEAKDGSQRGVVTLTADAVAIHAPRGAQQAQQGAPQQAPQGAWQAAPAQPQQQPPADPWATPAPRSGWQQAPALGEPPF